MPISIDLDDKIWPKLEGGYRIPYNASRPLKKLSHCTIQKEQEVIFKELWDNLHHQGDVGLASYLSVPQLVSICISKNSLDWNYIGLCTIIENCRLNGDNPELPPEFQEHYLESLTQFERYLLLHFKNISDRVAVRFALALFATVNGQTDLGKAIEILDEELLTEFLKKYL